MILQHINLFTFLIIGHRCILRACTIEDECLVGMGSILEEGSYMEKQSMLAGGSVLTKGTRVPSGEVCKFTFIFSPFFVFFFFCSYINKIFKVFKFSCGWVILPNFIEN